MHRPATGRALAGAPPTKDPAPDDPGAEIEALRQEVASLKARLARAEELADADVLTPVLNRRAFLRELNRSVDLVRRYGNPAALIYFDLDGFKDVNDRFGHPAGDAALMAVAERLLNNVRLSDVVGRLGGDEFAVILARADAATAQVKARALAAAIAAAPVLFEGARVELKASFGVREIDGIAPAEQVLAAADAAMFLRKPGRDAEKTWGE